MGEQAKKEMTKTRRVVSAILFAIAGLCILAVIILCIMFPDEINIGNASNTPNAPASTQIQYEKVDLQDMLDELDANALRAEEKYQDKYIEITGEIRSFDSDGKYISIAPCGAPSLSLDTVLCDLTDPAHKAFLLEKNKGDVVTIRGKVTSIGEVIGYHIDIAEISG